MSTFPAVFFQMLEDSENPSKFLDDPPIVAGDFRISNGGGPFVNLAILPVVDPAGSPQVKFQLVENERSNPGALIYGKDPDDIWREINFTPSDCTPSTTNTVVAGGAQTSAEIAAVRGRSRVSSAGGSGNVSKVSGSGGPRVSGGSSSAKIIAR
jgi:hypothetical protein